jgi:hypothetical protein
MTQEIKTQIENDKQPKKGDTKTFLRTDPAGGGHVEPYAVTYVFDGKDWQCAQLDELVADRKIHQLKR